MKKINPLILFYFFITLVLIGVNNHYGGNLKLPVYSDHWGIVHYPLEITGSNFLDSLQWEHTGVPGFRIIIYILEVLSKYINTDPNTLFYLLFIPLYFYVSSKFLFNIRSTTSKIIFFAVVGTTPFYLLTVVWPFHSGIVVLLIFCGCFVLLNKNYPTLLRLNIFILLMSIASLFWPLFNSTSISLIFVLAILNSIYFMGMKFLKSQWKFFLIGVFAVVISNAIPLKNYLVYGWYTPTSLAGFAKFNTIWPWVTEEKRLSLLNSGILNEYTYNFMARDFNGGENPLFLKNEKLYEIFIKYKNDKNLSWSVNEKWEYIDNQGNKIEFLNNLFHDPNYIEKREPIAVALFSYFNNIGNQFFSIYLNDRELRDAALNSIHERVVVPHTAPILYYKSYPIFGTWGEAKKIRHFPTIDLFLIDREIGSTLSFLSIFITIFSILCISTNLLCKSILNYNFGIKSILYAVLISSLLIKFKMVIFSLLIIIFYCIYIWLIRNFCSRKIISSVCQEQIIVNTVLPFFLLLLAGIFYSTMFEGMRYFGIILVIPITALILIFDNISFTKVDNEIVKHK